MSKQDNLTDFLTDVADAIRQKKGTQAPINPQDFSSEIASIPTGGNNPLQDMLDRSSDTDGSYLFYANSSNPGIFSQLTYEILTALDFSSKHYTNTSNMFFYCRSLTTIPQLNFSKVTNTSNMFSGSGVTTIPQLDFSSVTDASGMFSSCTSLTTIPQLIFSKVTSIRDMFYGCRSLTTIPQLNFSKVTNTAYMFNGCTSLTTIPQLDFSSVTDAGSMFYTCTSLTTIPQLNFSKVTNAGSMFYGCRSLTTIPQLNFSKVTNTAYMFNGCTSLTTLDFSNIKTIGPSFAQGIPLSTLIIRNPTILATLENRNAFESTPIARGTGYIYVPDDLVDRYKQATNWSFFANQIKPLSELPQGE